MTNQRLFKVLNTNGSAHHGGNGKWSLPHDGQPGDWMPPILGPLVACQNGYHLCTIKQLLNWIGPAIHEAEYRGERLDADDKTVVREPRLLKTLNWNERVARLFTCDCAERVVHLTTDPCCAETIVVARRYADGQATNEELATAAYAAAHTAATAAYDAAHTAAHAACPAYAAYAAYDAAHAAAYATAYAAAHTAATATAYAAAHTAATAAYDAAHTAAHDAATACPAYAAAYAAAHTAEQQWQAQRLLQYLDGELQ